MLPASNRFRDAVGCHVRLNARHHRIDSVPDRRARPARELHAVGRRREVELQLLGIEKRDVDRRVAAGIDLVLRQADDAERIAAKRNAIADHEPGAAVCHEFVVASDNAPSGNEAWRTTGPAGLVADHVEPQLLGLMLSLDRLVRDAAGGCDATDAGDRLTCVARDAGCFGERPAGA